jgi:hypothetical protein
MDMNRFADPIYSSNKTHLRGCRTGSYRDIIEDMNEEEAIKFVSGKVREPGCKNF